MVMINVLTERIRSQVQVFEMKFMRRIEGVTFLDKVVALKFENLYKRRAATSPNRKTFAEIVLFSHVSKMP